MAKSQVTLDAWKLCKLLDLKAAYTIYCKKIPGQEILTSKKDIIPVLQAEFERRRLLDEDHRDEVNDFEGDVDAGEDIVQ